MASQATVIEIIYRALRSLNEELEEDKRVVLAPDTRLFGPDASLDSLSLVSVIVDLELAVSEQFGQPISLTDDRAMSRQPVPFTDVTALQNYILEVLA
jgi:acyl carrier protein